MADKQKASPLSIAVPKIPVFEDEATAKARADYEKALQEVLATVEKRKNRLIEPTWAAIARGLQNSSRFSEGFESARREQQAEDELYAQQKLALAQAQMQMAGQGAQVRALRERFGIGGPQAPQAAPQGAPQAAPQPSAPQAGMPPSVAPVAPVVPSASVAPALREDVSGLPGAMSFEQFARMQLQEGITSESEIRKNWANYVKEMRTQVGGTTRVPGSKPLVDIAARQEVYIPELGGTLSVSVTDAMELDASRGNPLERKKIIDRIMMKETVTAPAGEPSKAAGAAPIKSIEQRKLEQDIERERGVGVAKGDVEKIKQYEEAGEAASGAILIAQQVKNIASQPNAKNILGVYSRPGLEAAFKRAGVDIVGKTFGLDEIKEILLFAGLSEEEVSQYQRAMFFSVNTQLETAALLKGAVSDFETKLVGKGGFSIDDTPQTLQFKADYVILRKTFDKNAADAFREGFDQGKYKSVAEWKRSKDYKNMKAQFEQDLLQLAEGKRLKVPGASQPARPTRPATPAAPSAASTRSQGIEIPDDAESRGEILSRRPL